MLQASRLSSKAGSYQTPNTTGGISSPDPDQAHPFDFFEKLDAPFPLKTGTGEQLLFWKIQPSNPGLVFQSNPLLCENRIAAFIESSIALRPFKLEIQVVENDENGELTEIELIVRTTPVTTDWTLLTWDLPVGFRNRDLVLRIYNTGNYRSESEFRFSEPFDPELSRGQIPDSFVYKFDLTDSLKGALNGTIKPLFFVLLWILPGVVTLGFLPCGRIFDSKPLAVFPALILVVSLWGFVVFAIAIFAGSFLWFLLLVIHATSWLLLANKQILQSTSQHMLRNPEFRTSLALWFLAAGIGMYSGMMFGGWQDIESTAAIRYSGTMLLADNQLPGLFVERLYQNLPLSPFYPEWLSSDRPPLQSALVLLIRSFFLNPTNDTQIFSILLQSLCIPFIYLLTRGIGLNRAISSAISISMVFTSSFLLNSLFVWPKLLPVSFLLATTVLLFHSEAVIGQRKPILRATLIGIASAFSLLAHGGSIFGLLPLFLTAIVFRKMPHPKHWLPMIVSFFVLMLPWVLYQKLMDPPGDKLLLWHLAGFIGDSDLSFFEILIAQYRGLSWEQWLDNKFQNLKVISGDWSLAFRHFYPFQFANHFDLLRSEMFRSFMVSQLVQLPFIFLAPLTILTRKAYQFALKTHYLLIISLLGLAIWTLMMFKPGRTVLHQGTYYLPFSFILFFVMLIAVNNPRTARWLWIIQFTAVSLTWVFPAVSISFSQHWIINKCTFDWVALSGYLILAFLSFSFYLLPRSGMSRTMK